MTGTGATQLWGATTRRAIGTTRQDVCKGGDQPPALTAWYFLCVGRGFPDAPKSLPLGGKVAGRRPDG